MLLISVYAGDRLRANNLKPDLSRRVPNALVEHVLNLSVVVVVEPDGEEAECVMKPRPAFYRSHGCDL